MKLKYTEHDESGQENPRTVEVELTEEESRMIAKDIVGHLVSMLHSEIGRSTFGIIKKSLAFIIFAAVMYIFAIETKIYDYLKHSSSVQSFFVLSFISHKWIKNPYRNYKRRCKQWVKKHRWNSY